MFKRDALEELIAYTDFAWEQQRRTLASAHPDLLTKAAPGSGWPALRDAFHHSFGAYDDWLHVELKLGEPILPDKETLSSVEAVDDYRARSRATMRRVLDELDDAGLYEKKPYQEEGDEELESLSMADVIANLLLHERGHHGDISTLFYQHGVESPFVDYRLFVYVQDPSRLPLAIVQALLLRA